MDRACRRVLEESMYLLLEGKLVLHGDLAVVEIPFPDVRKDTEKIERVLGDFVLWIGKIT